MLGFKLAGSFEGLRGVDFWVWSGWASHVPVEVWAWKESMADLFCATIRFLINSKSMHVGFVKKSHYMESGECLTDGRVYRCSVVSSILRVAHSQQGLNQNTELCLNVAITISIICSIVSMPDIVYSPTIVLQKPVTRKGFLQRYYATSTAINML